MDYLWTKFGDCSFSRFGFIALNMLLHFFDMAFDLLT